MKLGKPACLNLYCTMVLIRAFENRVHELLGKGEIHGTSHLCAGQEAVAAGACSALKASDFIISNHRGHGHFIAKGGDPRMIMAELFGKAAGYSRGRGGSQHMACREIGFLGSNGITGGGIPVATGAALALKMRRSDSIVLCFFGDGASNQGTFHESLNMASLWNLPIVFLCENNLYGMSTPVRESTAIENIADRAAAYGMRGRIVDGNDVLDVRGAVAEEARKVRSGGKPVLIECRTYRIYGHSRSDRCTYRPAGEEEAWRKKDPITLFGNYLAGRGFLSEEEARVIEREQKTAVEEAVEFARRSPVADPGELDGSQYAEPAREDEEFEIK